MREDTQLNRFVEKLVNKNEDVVDFVSTKNFLQANITINFNDINTQTLPSYDLLYEVLCKKYNTNKDEIEIFNESNNAISYLMQYLKKNYCTIYSPANQKYKNACLLNNYEYDLINIFTQINRGVQENSLVIFENPTSLNGKYYDISTYLKAWSALNCVVLIDETYLDFTNKKSLSKYINEYDNLYILKTINKFYSLEGVQFVSLISNKTNIENLRKRKAYYKISSLDSLFIQNIFKDNTFEAISKAIIVNNQLILEKVLLKSKYVNKVYKSDVNFLLVELKNITSDLLQEHLAQYNICIYNCFEDDYLGNTYIRVSVNNEESIVKLQKVLYLLS